MAIFSRKVGLQDLVAEQLVWDAQLEATKGPLAEARARAQEARELALLGQGDVKALAKAEESLAGHERNLETCITKLSSLKELQIAAATENYDQRVAAAPAETPLLGAEQMAGGIRMAKSMAMAAFLQASFFKNNDRVAEISFLPFVYGVPPHLEIFLETFQRSFQEELARLRSSESGPATFFERVTSNRNLRIHFNDFRESAVQEIIRKALAEARGEK